MSADPLRVLHVISGIDVGGAENHLLTLCTCLAERDYDVTVAYLKGKGGLADEFRAAGTSVVEVGIRADADPLGFLNLVRHVRNADYDIVHGHLFHGNVYGVTAAALGGVPNIVSSKHNDPPFWRRQPYAFIHEVTLRQADLVLPISDHVREYLLANSRVERAKVETVHYGLDPSPFDSVGEDIVAETRAEFVDDETPLLGTVARLTEQKDLETLLRSFANVREDGTGAHLAIVGRGEQAERLQSLAADLGVVPYVTFTGFREDIPALMRAFDVFALTSRWEGFGVVLLESMAARTPVIVSDVSAIPEVVEDKKTGLLVEPGNVQGFATAIESLLSAPDKRREMGEAGRERLEREFTVERMVDEIATRYDRLLSH